MRRLSDEQGAAAITVAVLMVAIFGFAALAVDVGALFGEHRQLQSGADAAALAVAQECARAQVYGAPYQCTQAGADAMAAGYADENANDGASDLADPVDITLTGAQSGEVTATALVNDGGENTLRHWFAGIFGSSSSRVETPATAVFAPMTAGTAFPVTICEGEYEDAIAALPGGIHQYELKTTGQGQGGGQGGGKGGDDGDDGDDGEVGPCDPQSPTGDLPGDFGWLELLGGPGGGAECAAQVRLGGSAGVTPGTAVPGPACNAPLNELATAIDSGADAEARTRSIAIYSEKSGTGNNGEYELVAFVGFEFTALKFPSYNAIHPSDAWSSPCDGPGSDYTCIRGRFTSAYEPVSELTVIDPNATNSDVLGVQLVK